MLNKETALRVEKGVSGGFNQPDLGWCLINSDHLDGVSSENIFSDFWIGSARSIRALADHLIDMYISYRDDEELLNDLGENDNISILYWEIKGISMCAVLITGDEKFSVPKNLDEIFKVKQILFNGNNNSPKELLKENSLTAEEKVLISNFITENTLKKLLNGKGKNLYFEGLTNEQFKEVGKLI